MTKPQNTLHKFQSTAFSYIVYVTWVLYIIVALGLISSAPEYLDYLQFYVKIYISIFLIWRFNPLFRRLDDFNELDARISYSAGLFLLTTTAINSALQTYIKNIQAFIAKLTHMLL